MRRIGSRSLWGLWPRLVRTFARERLIVLFDFDGTLAPITTQPSLAQLPADTRRALARLTKSKQVSLGVVSGRALAELQSLVRLKTIWYIGSHGLEWAGPAGGLHLGATPASLRRIAEIWRELHDRLRPLPGIYVERKPASVAVHCRNASVGNARRALLEVNQVVECDRSRLQLLRGKKVVEVLPSDAPGKGAAVQALLRRLLSKHRDGRIIYFGDDLADETVFARLRKNDMGVFVGKPRRSNARYYLRSPGEVREFLQRLCTIVT